jgi:hypothetical protein
MRMRKLGFGQSVVFLASEEIESKIRERTGRKSDLPIGVDDVLCWSIGETWEDLRKSMPSWAVQGERFERTKGLLRGTATPVGQLREYLEDESQTLQRRYKPDCHDRGIDYLFRGWGRNNTNINNIIARCKVFGAMSLSAAGLNEEQERELAPEVEEERQIERPPRLTPRRHQVHHALWRLAQTGEVLLDEGAFRPAFLGLVSTSAAELFEAAQFPADVLVTTDFMHTVEKPASASQHSFVSDSYQRPVQFVLSVPQGRGERFRKLVIISPFEANELFGTIKEKRRVTLHLFSPRMNAAYASLDKLELFNVGHAFNADEISRSATQQLNLFAGSLYLRSIKEYGEICDALGLARCSLREDRQVLADGFIDPPIGQWGLQSSPIPFLRSLLMKIRREGEGIQKTHLGKILNGVRLGMVDFVQG